jgi:hypothetical protein
MLFALSAPLVAFASHEPAAGDTRAAIEPSLGTPSIRRRMADGSVITKYPRGTVTYRDDRAVALNLIPAAEWRARIEAEQKARAEAESRRLADKTALDELLVSKSYRQLSVSGRIAELDTLRVRHPAADTGALRADLVARQAREIAADARIRAVEQELADTRRQVETLRNTPPPAPVIIEKTRVVEVPVETQPAYIPTQPVYGFSTVHLHSPRQRHDGQSGRDPLNNTPAVGTPGQVIPHNPISQFTITGPKPASNVIPNNPVAEYTIGANPVPVKPADTRKTERIRRSN